MTSWLLSCKPSPSEKVSTQNGQNWFYCKFFPFWIDPFAEGRQNIFGRVVYTERVSLSVTTAIWAAPCENVSLGICGHITKTCLHKFDTLKPHFYIEKLGSTGVYIIFFIFAQKHNGYSLEPPRRGGSNEYLQLCFEQNYEKYRVFFLTEKNSVFGSEIFYIFE